MAGKKKVLVGWMYSKWKNHVDLFPNVRPKQFYIPPIYARGEEGYVKVRITIEEI